MKQQIREKQIEKLIALIHSVWDELKDETKVKLHREIAYIKKLGE